MISLRYLGILGICGLVAACAQLPRDHPVTKNTLADPASSSSAPLAENDTADDADATILASHSRATGSALQSGEASWYASKFQGRRTASGERYNGGALTAAHRTLPLGTWVRVTSLATGRSVVVRINDRGPFIAGRIIDLSWAAAKALGLPYAHSKQVRIERFGKMTLAYSGADGSHD
nr:septal ring lytic transglycosylase RlpA family protein [Paraburkholderia sp. J11-2]